MRASTAPAREVPPPKHKDSVGIGSAGPELPAATKALPDERGTTVSVALPSEMRTTPAAAPVTAPVAVAPATATVPAATVPVAQQAVAAPGAVESALAPLPATSPLTPLESATPWAMLAAARRELGDRSVVDTVSAAAAAATASAVAPSFDQIIQYTLFHRSATANPVQNPGQLPNGVVTGNLNARSDNGAALVYSVAEFPARGSVLLSEDGSYTYTPYRDFAAEGGSDTFRVTVDNGSALRLTGIEGAIQSLFSTIAQLIGLRQPDTVTVSVPVSIVGNTAPVIDTPTVGTPNASTGVVLGQINATDAEGGTLTYGGSTNTAKGTVSINSSTGAFTYTPNSSSRGIRTGTDSFIATVTDGFGGAASIEVPVPVAAWVATNPLITYSFNVISGAQYWTPDALRVLQFAADRIASYITVTQPVTLTFNISGQSSPDSTTLASAGSNLTGFVFSTGYFYTVVQGKLIRGTDFNGASADGSIDVNFGKSWSYGDDVSFDEYDFASVLMHEMMHAYGFTSGVTEPGTNTRRNWPIFDSGIVDDFGIDMIDETYRFNTALNPNLTGGNGGLYFAGANAVNAYGGLVPLYTPSLWDDGSSVVHLDDSFYNQLMVPSAGRGPRVRVLSAIERGILQDMGYTVQNPVWASMLFVGFLFIRRKRAS